jgi:hypothetical protein
MSVSVAWDNSEKTVIRYTAEGKWTWDEFYLARDAARAWMDSVSHSKINFIIDVRSTSIFPSNALSHFGRMPSHTHPKSGMIVMVGVHRFAQVLVDMMTHLNSAAMNKFCMVSTMEQAREILAARQVYH